MTASGDHPKFEVLARGVVQRLVVANVIGGVLVLLFLVLLAPQSSADPPSFGLVAAVFTAYVVSAVAAGVFLGVRQARHALLWLIEERTPTDAERRATLAQPWRLTVGVFVLWIGAVVLFGGWLAVGSSLSTDDVLRTSAFIALGGLTSCGLGYLLVERHGPGVRASVLAGVRWAPSTTRFSTRRRLLVFWGLGSGVPLACVALAQLGQPLEGGGRQALFLAVVGLVAGAMVLSAAADTVTRPLEHVRNILKRVGDGDLSARVRVDDTGEIGELQVQVNQMVDGLLERERLRDLLDRHVGREVASAELGAETGVRSHRSQATVLFVDLVDSTGLAQSLDAEAVVAHLNTVFAITFDTVARHGGWVNKFLGDGALCVFGVPAGDRDHATRALRAARELIVTLHSTAAEVPIAAAVGVSSGEVVAGNMGSEDRYEYTVIGDVVNEAARLVEAAKSSPERLLASGTVVSAAAEEERGHWSQAGPVALRGRRSPTVTFVPRADG